MAPEARPMETTLGPEVGDLVRRVHEEHGVVFHLGTTPTAFDGNGVALLSGERLETDFVVVGIGVRPRTALAEQSGITVDRGSWSVSIWRPTFLASTLQATSPVGPTG